MGHSSSKPTNVEPDTPDTTLRQQLQQELLTKFAIHETRVTDELRKQLEIVGGVQNMASVNAQTLEGMGDKLAPFVEAQKGSAEALALVKEKADHAIAMMTKQAVVISTQQDVIEKLGETVRLLSKSLRTAVLAIDTVVPCFAKHRFRCVAMSDMDVSSLDISERVELYAYGHGPNVWKALVTRLTETIDTDAEQETAASISGVCKALPTTV